MWYNFIGSFETVWQKKSMEYHRPNDHFQFGSKHWVSAKSNCKSFDSSIWFFLLSRFASRTIKLDCVWFFYINFPTIHTPIESRHIGCRLMKIRNCSINKNQTVQRCFFSFFFADDEKWTNCTNASICQLKFCFKIVYFSSTSMVW